MITSINPSVKALAVLVPGILLGFSYDIFTPLVYLLFSIAVTFLLTDLSFLKWIKILVPFIVMALGFAWMAFLYTNDTFSGGEVLYEFWIFDITTGGIRTGISLALRSLCFVTLSLLFVLTTDPTKFMMSLMQQCKLPPKLTYGILAGYRFLPIFRHELQILHKAHQIRGVERIRGFKGKLHQFRRYSIPLLANGIRKAERVAIAMESKGFTGDRNRTYFHQLTVGSKDWLFLALMIGGLLLTLALSYYFGYLRIFGWQVG